MSQSPTEFSASLSASDPYTGAWGRLTRMILAGTSLSGNERNCCFLNMGQQRLTRDPPRGGAGNGRTAVARFANISLISGLDFEDDGRSVTQIDWDGDGDLDLWLANRSGPQLRFMRNEAGNQNRWLALKLAGNGKTTNRDAIGARVEVTASHTDAQRPPVVTAEICGYPADSPANASPLGTSAHWIPSGDVHT